MQSIATQTAINATPDLAITNGQITTTSTQVAEHFGKRHRDVLRAIRNLEVPTDWHKRNFAPMLKKVAIGNGAEREETHYAITRDGFTVLGMGFTGKEAMHWKLAYIEAFNQMEAQLVGKTDKLPPARPRQTVVYVKDELRAHILRSRHTRPPVELPSPGTVPTKLSRAQAEGITLRLGGFATLFHPSSDQFADVNAILRILRGMDPDLGVPGHGYLAVM